MSVLPVIKFKHAYYKLGNATFTTIRGKSYFRRFEPDQLVTVEYPGGMFVARILGLQVCTIESLPVAFLKNDAEYPGFTFSSQQDFCDLLNSFRARFWTQVTPQSEMTIITLEKQKI
jgi:hypothetical protein